jgi:DNA-binding GntR family transcriptional regulator
MISRQLKIPEVQMMNTIIEDKLIQTFDENKEKPLSLRQQLYKALKHAIISCELAPGDSISEKDLAEQFGVSKTPVREALTSLQQCNLVEYTINRGFRVSTISFKDVQEIYEARIFYETGLFSLAVKHVSDADILYLNELNTAKLDFTEVDNVDTTLQNDTDFHMYIALVSGNNRLVMNYQIILDESRRFMYLDFKRNKPLHAWYSNHTLIIEALRNRDEIGGANVIREILNNQKTRIFG